MPHLDQQFAASVRPYIVTAANTVTLRQVVVEGTNDGEVKNPTAADVRGIVGVVVGLGPLNGGPGDQVMVQRDGDCSVKAGATVARGDTLSIFSAAGSIKTAAPA